MTILKHSAIKTSPWLARWFDEQTFATEPANLSLTLRTHMVEGDKQLHWQMQF